MKRRVIPVLGLLVMVVTGAWTAPARAGASAEPVRVTYTSGDLVYLDAGEDDGLRPGTVVEVTHSGRTVGSLRVLFVSARTASGSLATGQGVVGVGDQVTFTRHGAPPVAVTPMPTEKEPVTTIADAGSPARTAHRSRGWFRDRGINGRIGIGAMNVGDHGSGSRRTLQQTLDVRVTGTNVGGTPLSMAIDVRTRRTERTASGDVVREGMARVNLASAAWRPSGGPFELSVGRQTIAPLGSVGVLDGVLARYASGRWQFGAVTATQPAPVTNAFANDVREHGAYARFESPREAPRRVSLGLGAVGSYRGGQVDRECVTLQQGYDDARLSAFVSEEIDLNRGWKKAAGEKPFGVTSFYSYVNHRLSGRTSLTAGFDNRRNPRMLRDRDNGEGGFDDAYRDGAWAGFNARIGERFDVRCDSRWSGLHRADQSDSYNLSLGASRLWPFEMALRTHSTRFRGADSEGWVHGLNCDLAPTSRTHLALRGGTKQDPSVAGGSSLDRYLWYGVDFDLSVGRHWFLLLSGERRRESGSTVEQLLAKSTWRL